MTREEAEAAFKYNKAQVLARCEARARTLGKYGWCFVNKKRFGRRPLKGWQAEHHTIAVRLGMWRKQVERDRLKYHQSLLAIK